MQGLLTAYEGYIKSLNITDFDYKLKSATQLELLGYVDLTTNKPEDRRKLLVTEVIPLHSKDKDNENIWGYAVFSRSIGTGKTSRLTVRANLFNNNPIKKMDIIYASIVDKNKQGYWYLLEYHKII
jgi:hypothetical protein